MSATKKTGVVEDEEEETPNEGGDKKGAYTKME
jgi:hypothetical protein